MKDYGTRQSIITQKKKLQDNAKENNSDRFKKAFTVEDLTQLRSKLLWYAKNRCDGKFLKCHTKEGRILAQKVGNLKPDEWISLSSPDEFHAHGVDIDIDVINNGLKRIKVLKPFEFERISDMLD